MSVKSIKQGTKRRLTMSPRYSVVKRNNAMDIIEQSISQTKVETREDRMYGSEGGFAGSIRFPTSNPTRNIER